MNDLTQSPQTEERLDENGNKEFHYLVKKG